MKVVIPISTDRVRDKDILDVLEEKENRSEYIRHAIRFYIEFGDNDKTHQMDIRRMMEEMLSRMDDLAANGITYVDNNQNDDDVVGSGVIMNDTRNKGLSRMRSKVNAAKVESNQRSVEDQPGFEDISSALDSLGNN